MPGKEGRQGLLGYITFIPLSPPPPSSPREYLGLTLSHREGANPCLQSLCYILCGALPGSISTLCLYPSSCLSGRGQSAPPSSSPAASLQPLTPAFRPIFLGTGCKISGRTGAGCEEGFAPLPGGHMCPSGVPAVTFYEAVLRREVPLCLIPPGSITISCLCTPSDFKEEAAGFHWCISERQTQLLRLHRQ